jgi:hypothetical protein
MHSLADRDRGGVMRKYLWAIIAGVCVLMLVAVGVAFVPRLLNSSSGETNQEILEPGHWQRAMLNKEQVEILRALWGKEVTIAQLIEEVWPGVLQEIPAEGVSVLDQRSVDWPAETMDEALKFPLVFCAGYGLPAPLDDSGSTPLFYCYIGTEAWERNTLFNVTNRRAETLYRISMYIDDVCTVGPLPPDSSVDLKHL